MARRRGRSRAVRGGPKNQVWAVSVADDITNPSTTTTVLANLVAETDWASSGSSAEAATVLRVRGWLSMRQTAAAGVGSPGGIFMYIIKQDDDAVFPDGSAASTYADEDILWTGGVYVPSLGDLTVRSFIKDWVIDVKVMRKIRTGQNLALIATNTTTGAMQFSGVIRSLVRKGGN